MKRILLLSILIFYYLTQYAQIQKATIGINGLTCSQCSRSVMKQLEKIPFVKSVEMDLEETIAYVDFKNSNKIYFEDLAEAVTKAGFSVRTIDIEIQRNDRLIFSNNIIYNDEMSILLDNVIPDKEKISIRLIGEKYHHDKEANKRIATIESSPKIKMRNYYGIILH